MWMGKPCCDCDDSACPTGILCISTYNPYTNAPIAAIADLPPYPSGDTTICFNITFADVGIPIEFSLSGPNLCNSRTFQVQPADFPRCSTLSTGIPLCKTTFYYEETYDVDGVQPCSSPTIASMLSCPGSGAGTIVLGEDQSIGSIKYYINGSSISCPLVIDVPDGTLRVESCFDEPLIGLANFSGKTVGYESPYDWTCVCEGEFLDDCGLPNAHTDFYMKNCTETEITHCTSNNVTVEKEIHHSCDEFWELECTKDADRIPYNGCCPDPTTWTDSRFKLYEEDSDCLCADYTMKASPCFTMSDYTLVFNGAAPFSGNCENFFGQFGLPCPNYSFTVDGPITLINTGASGSHTNTWQTVNGCCVDFVTPYQVTLNFCNVAKQTELVIQVCGRGVANGVCLCPDLNCPGFLDTAYTETKTFSGIVVSCDPIDIDFYDIYGNVIGSVTQ